MKNRNYSVVYRTMHWAIATCILLLLLTIFLRLTWMNKEHVAGIIQDHFSTADQSMPREEAVLLAKKIRRPMWDWHIYFGYALVGLYCIRMVLPFFGAMKFSSPFQKPLSLKVKFQYWVYLVFYGCVAISLATGLIIKFGAKEMKEAAEEIHVLSIYYLLAYIALHLGGVLLAEFTDQQGIVSRIVSGTGKDKGIK